PRLGQGAWPARATGALAGGRGVSAFVVVVILLVLPANNPDPLSPDRLYHVGVASPSPQKPRLRNCANVIVGFVAPEQCLRRIAGVPERTCRVLLRHWVSMATGERRASCPTQRSSTSHSHSCTFFAGVSLSTGTAHTRRSNPDGFSSTP